MIRFYTLVRLYGGGAAAVGAFSVLIALLVLSTAPVNVQLDLFFDSTGDTQWDLVEDHLNHWLKKQDDFQSKDCHLTKSLDRIDKPVYSCTITAPNSDAYFDAIDRLHQGFPRHGAEVFGWEMSTYPRVSLVPIWSILLATAVHLILVYYLTRNVDLWSDLVAAVSTLKLRPWLPFALVGIWFVVANVSAGVLQLIFGENIDFPVDQGSVGDRQNTFSVYQAGIEMMLTRWHVVSSFLLAPLIEETVFRQVVYKKVDGYTSAPVHAVVNAWFFMIAHVIVAALGQMLGIIGNPVQSSIVLVPVWFFIGLFLFWVRYRYESLSLCILLHSFYNTATLVAAYLVLTG